MIQTISSRHVFGSGLPAAGFSFPHPGNDSSKIKKCFLGIVFRNTPRQTPARLETAPEPCACEIKFRLSSGWEKELCCASC
jgi:hypothetical protein